MKKITNKQFYLLWIKNLSLVLLILIIFWAIKTILTKPVALQDIEVPSTFSTGDQQQFTQRLEEIQAMTGLTYTGIIEKARMYDYLGFPGQALLVYQDFMETSTGEYFAVYNNVGKLYEKICVIDERINKTYCLKAIEYYQKLINKYGDNTFLKHITTTYIKMKNKNKAQMYYELYKQKTGGRESWIEKKIESL